MSLESLKTVNKVIGVKQVTKAVGKGLADQVWLAANAERRVVEPLKKLCGESGIEVREVPTMRDLGRACAIEVGAAAVAVLKQ